MAEAVYLLCALTSLVCAALLVRSYVRNRTTLLLWSSICFVCLAANNVLLFLDKVVLADVDLALERALSGFIGVAALVVGLVWSQKQ